MVFVLKTSVCPVSVSVGDERGGLGGVRRNPLHERSRYTVGLEPPCVHHCTALNLVTCGKHHVSMSKRLSSVQVGWLKELSHG